MKAYQLKIIEQKQKPPVWWRIIIPGGITFSALSVIIDALPAESGYDESFLFRFYQELELFEASEERPLKTTSWQYSVREASSTFIDDYFDYKSRLSYKTDKVLITIEIEKVLKTEDSDVPSVIKTSSNIDANLTNKRIKQDFSVVIGHPSFLKKAEIINNLSTSHQLVCAKSPKSAEDNYVESVQNKMKETAELLQVAVARQNNIRIYNELRKMTYPQLLNCYSLNALKKEAKELGIQRYTVMEKQELCNAIAEILLDPEIVRKRLSSLFPGDFEVMKKIIAANGVLRIDDGLDEIGFRDIQELCYGFLFEDMIAVIPKEFIEVYKQIDGGSIIDNRLKQFWIEFILEEVVPIYYGMIPIESFSLLCSCESDPIIKQQEVMGIFNQIDSSANPCFLLNGCIADKRLKDKRTYQHIKEAHSNKPFDIVPFSELEVLYEEGYPANNMYYIQMKSYLFKETDLDEDDIEYILGELHEIIAFGGGFNEIFSYFNDEDLYFSFEETRRLTPIIQGLVNNTRTYYNCGYTPSEMGRIMRRRKPASVIQMPRVANNGNKSVKKEKIRPNDPCPCGSGKKYKKCCGKPQGS